MATTKQVKAAKRNVKKAQAGASKKRSIAHMSAGQRTALGKQGAAVAQRKRTGGLVTEDEGRALRGGEEAEPPRPLEDGSRRAGEGPGPMMDLS